MHLGVRVTLTRTDSTGRLPAERVFEDADNWIYDNGSLFIVKNTTALGTVERVTIAEFTVGKVESVEFISKERA